jgi:hypothetical protein
MSAGVGTLLRTHSELGQRARQGNELRAAEGRFASGFASGPGRVKLRFRGSVVGRHCCGSAAGGDETHQPMRLPRQAGVTGIQPPLTGSLNHSMERP